MGKQYADHTGAQTQQPLIINPRTVDTYNDAALLNVSQVLSQGDNIILDDGMIEKTPGSIRVSGTDTSAYGVMGLHRTYSPAGTKIALKLWNGTLKSAVAPNATTTFATTVLANLAANKRTPWIDVRGKAYGVNETDGVIRYDANTAIGMKTGIVGPFLRKKIAFFEDDETWTTTVGGSQSTAVARPEEWTGKTIKSLRLYCSAASTTAYSTCTIPLDLSKFGDDKAVGDEDYISFYTFHGSRNNLSAARIIFSSRGTTFASAYHASLDQALYEDGDHEWTKWNVRRSAFSTLSGSPSWSSISAVRLMAKSNAIGATTLHFDYMYLKAAPVKLYEMRKNIFKCESIAETWTGKGNTFDYKYQHEGIRSVRLTGAGATSATCVLSNPIDLSSWGNGSAISSSDELVFHIRASNVAKVSAASVLTLRVGSGVSAYSKRTWGTLSALGLTGDSQWKDIRVPKARISAATASISAVNWSAVNRIAFITGAIVGTSYINIDDCYFEPKVDAKQIADMETDETWNITGKGAMITDPQGKGKVTEGDYALSLWSSRSGHWAESSAIRSLSAGVLNLTTWTDGGNSDTNDIICFSLFHQRVAKIDWVEIQFDNNSLATFVNYYKYRITKDMFAGGGVKNNMGKEIAIAKKDFDKVGSTGSWATIGAIKFIVYSKGNKTTGAVILDDIQLRRTVGHTGRYYYKHIFKIGDVASAASDVSEHIDTKNAGVSLFNITTSQDSRVTSREIYRLGGSYPETWGLVKVIEDNTTTEMIDSVDDDDITYFLGDDVPNGWINSVLCNNLVHDPYSDRVLYWGDPTYKNRVYYSHPGFYHVVDEWGYREFPDDVQSVVPWFGQTIIFYKHSIQKIVDGDISTGSLIDVPAEMGACSYWAVGKPWNGMIPYVGQDNIYLFDGIRSRPIGEEVKGYFKGRENYLSTVNAASVKDALYIACKEKTGTPAYNDTVLRCYLPNKSWTMLPDYNVNVWSNWDKQDDANELYYGDSLYGYVHKINDTGYLFGSSNIASTVGTGWLSVPDADIAIQRIEFKAKGTDASTLAFKGYINLGATASTQGTVTLTTAWQTFRLGPKGIQELLRGNNIKIEFAQTGQNAWFKIRDIVIYYEKLSERVSITTANEVTCAAP